MNKTLIVGNWKMHLNTQQASLLVHRLQNHVAAHRDIEMVLAPSMLSLQPLSVQLDRRKFRLACQNAYATDEGAMTGEVSFAMLHELVHYAIIGHSERRQHSHETLEVVRDKVQAAVRNQITPIICVGETVTEKHAGETKRVVHDQVVSALSNVTGQEVATSVIAYEPIWAIGSGEPATAYAVKQVVGYIRDSIAKLYGNGVAEDVRILYGGSVVPEFVTPMLSEAAVDGFLVGGASLNYHQFGGIVEAAHLWRVTHHDS